MKKLTCIFPWLVLLVLLATGGGARAQSADRVFPAGANVVNLKAAPYNAKGDGVADDTDALQQAMDDYIRTGRILYLPNGTYRISRPLYWRPKSNSFDAAAFLMLQGQSRTGTIIQLQDNAAAFQDKASPKALLRTAPLSNGANFNADSEQGFRNAVRDLTFNTGKGNPGAIALQFYCNNQGMAERLNLVSGDGQGPTGLDLSFFGGDGPGMCRDIKVQGFDVGIRLVYGLNWVLENMEVENQNQYGVWSKDGRTALRHFKSTNAVPAIRLHNGDGLNTLVLLDSELNGTGAASGRTAIESNGYLYARNVRTSGYSKAIVNGGRSVANGLVEEFTWLMPYSKLFEPSPDRSLGLPIKDMPEVPWGDPATDWANVVDYGADPTGAADATEAVQKAIDAGKKTVYFPNGKVFRLSGTVLLRGAVRRVLGNEARLRGTGGFKLVEGTAPVVVFEQFFEEFNNSVHLEQASGRTLAVVSVTGLRYDLNGPGDVFVSDITTQYFYPNTAGASIWARQFNIEYTTVNNKGGKLWVLGMKVESESTWLNTTNGGSTELLSSLVYASGGKPKVPMFINNESNVSLVAVTELNFNGNFYDVWVRETRSGVTKDLTRGAVLGRSIPMAYSGFAEPPAPNPAPLISALAPATAVAGSAALTLSVTGSNFVASSVVSFNGTDLATTFSSATQLTALVPASALAVAGTYEVRVRTPAPGGGTSGPLPFVVTAAPLPAPTITGLAPLSGPVGTLVTVTGTNLTGTTALRLNGTAVTGFTAVSATSLTFTVAAGASSGLVALTTPGGTATSTQRFTVSVVTATSAAQALPGLLVYPNPTTGALLVRLPTAEAATVALRELTGRLVLAPVVLPADGRLQLPATLARGLYLLEVSHHGTTAVRRLELR